MVAREIDLATGNEKAAMNEFGDAISEVAGKVWTVVSCAAFAQATGDEDFWKTIGKSEFHVGVGLVVAEQDVEARLALLDEIIFKRQGFMLVGDEDVVEINGLAHERAGFCVGL